MDNQTKKAIQYLAHSFDFHYRYYHDNKDTIHKKQVNEILSDDLKRNLSEFNFINSDINETNFPIQPIRGKVEILKFEKYISKKEVLEKIKEKGFEPANLDELLDYVKKDWNKKDWTFTLGSVWRGLVPCVNGYCGHRELDLDSTESDWSEDCSFAVIKKDNTLNRIEEKIQENNGCWEWQGGKRKGYGLISINGRKQSVHRVLYELLKTKIPKGMVTDHLCRNHSCVNPNHIEIVTNKENTLRGNGSPAKNARKTKCIRGHNLSGDNLYINKHKKRICRQCNKERMKK